MDEGRSAGCNFPLPHLLCYLAIMWVEHSSVLCDTDDMFEEDEEFEKGYIRYALLFRFANVLF